MLWTQLNLQEGMSNTMELLNYFHDYMMMILLLIMLFVSYIFLFVIYSPFSDTKTIDSHVLETIWTVIPMVVLLFMAFPSLILLYVMEEVSSPSLYVKVIGAQWYWEYEMNETSVSEGVQSNHAFTSQYSQAQGLLESGAPCLTKSVFWWNLDVDVRLTLPVQSEIMFLITSKDVLHSWTVPVLGVKVDAVPGRLNYVTATALSSGVYYGQCSEICGANHSFMPIVLEFVPLKFWVSNLG